jgi:hypothetical protein
LGRAAAQNLLRTDPLSEASINLIADAVMNAYAPGHRAELLAEAAATMQARIDADRARWPRRSNDRTALAGAREIVLGLINSPAATPDEERTRRNAVLDAAQARADRAAVTRVRELAERWENALAPDLPYARSLHAALDGQHPAAEES